MQRAITEKISKVANNRTLTTPVKTKTAKSTKEAGKLAVDLLDLQGKSVSKVSLPKEIFGQTPNKNLLIQAVHIYQENSKPKTAHTKTRGEVRGGGAKPWRQKGTGRARAGSIRSPLWVGGGTTFGPRAENSKLSLPAKMKHKALISALSAKNQSGEIRVIKNIEKIQPKTRVIANLLKKLGAKGRTLLIVSAKNQNLKLAARNIQEFVLITPQNLNAFEILRTRNILVSQEALIHFASSETKEAKIK